MPKPLTSILIIFYYFKMSTIFFKINFAPIRRALTLWKGLAQYHFIPLAKSLGIRERCRIKKRYLGISLFFSLLLPLLLSAQTTYFEPDNINVNINTPFSLPLKIKDVQNLFAINFDLNFDANLLEYVGTQEGDFLKQGCSTVLMTNANTPGKLIFGLTRLGASCGGVSGSGLIATMNFRSKSQNGIANLTFSNNSLCILNGASCNYINGIWNTATVTIGNPDTTPPVISLVSASSITDNYAVITWTTDELSDSQIEYGLTANYGSQTTLNTSMVTSHSQNLTGLSLSTTYHYRVKSRDAAGNLGTSDDFTFKTFPLPSIECAAGKAAAR